MKDPSNGKPVYFLMDKLPRYLRGATRYFDAEAWAVIAKQAERKRTGSPSNTRKGWETRRRNIEARQKLELARKRAEHARDWSDKIETRGKARWHILNAFEPGAWFALSDIAKLSGVGEKTVKAKINNLLVSEGLIAKVDNPDWRDLRNASGFKVWKEPRYLYGLTQDGIAARAVARGELEARGWPKYATGEKEPP